MTESRAREVQAPDPPRRTPELSDRRLLAGVRAGDPGALGRFFDLAFPYVYSLAHRMLGDRGAAEDLSQEVFLKVHRASSRILADRDARPWLTRITMNACRDSLRRRAVRHAESGDDGALASLPSPESSPADLAQRQEQEQRLREALACLDLDQRSVVLLRDYSGCSHEEIAELLGIEPATVRKRYSRAVERLRAWLEKP